MSHFAEVDKNGVVVNVIVVDQEFINNQAFGDWWVQTSYNTRGGKHYPPDSNVSDGAGLRKNYAGIGYTYDKIRDAFYAPQPFASWILDNDTCLWNAPEPMPDDGKKYLWDEANTEWKEME
jgi:hypothetical protein